MKFKLLIISVLALSVLSAHADEKDEAYLRSVLRAETNLVVIGESHNDVEVTVEEVRAISALKNIDPTYDCFFSETDRAYAEDFRPFNEDSSTYEETIGLAFEKFEEEHGPSNNLLPKSLAEAARSAGLRVVPVDISWASEAGKKAWRSAATKFNSGRAYLENRTFVMAEAVTEEFRAGRCSHGIFVVGANHVFKKSLANGPVHSMREYLAPTGLITQYFKVSKLEDLATPILPPAF